MFDNLLNEIVRMSRELKFDDASLEVEKIVDVSDDFIDILKQIGTIPECIEHDSTEEKLFSKASDAALSRAFRELGLKSTVLKERGDSADVIAESKYHGYTLVADAKAFRLSRTAKNQKDFKVTALSGWRKDADYAVLCSPYFQYPVSRSQIYAQAVDHNVCLLSWEHLLFLIRNHIKETEEVDLSLLWNVSGRYAQHCVVAEKKKCFTPVVDDTILEVVGKTSGEYSDFLNHCRSELSIRAEKETAFWESEIERISAYTREEAISELIRTRKIDEKIVQIKKYIAGLKI